MKRIGTIGMVCMMGWLWAPRTWAKDVLTQAVAQAQQERAVPAAQAPTKPAEPQKAKVTPAKVKIGQIEATGVIEGSNLTLSLAFDAEVLADNQEIALVCGELVLDQLTKPTIGYKLRYDADNRTYYMGWPRRGKYHVEATFAARAQAMAGKAEWREARFVLPASQRRQLKVQCDRTDLQVQFPGAMRVERTREQDHLVVTAIAGPGKPFVVRWKPQVEQLDAKLVVSSEANTVATVSAAALRIDCLFVFDIAQGKLDELHFVLPRSLGVTQVRGVDIREWSVDDAAGPDRLLKVSLVRPEAQQYALHIIAEQPLPPFPCELALPVIRPADGIRAGGHLAVGTSSAIQLQVRQTSGLSQIDTTAFPRVLMDRRHPRALPAAKAFYYAFAASPYQLQVKLDDIVPSYDASHRMAVTVREDDLVIDALVTLDVRDAPIRTVSLTCPAGYMVAAVTGTLVDDYRVRTDENRGPSNVTVQFTKPVLGTTNLQLRLELGRGPLDQAQAITPIRVDGAKAERGEMVVAAEPGVRFDTPEMKNLREVNLANVESNVPHGRLAYKFRQADWSLSLTAHRKPAGIRTESFHLISLGEGRLFGSVAVSYYITGSPIDELHFRLPKTLKNVQFIGRDVRRTSQDGEQWTVKLQRKVIGDYNLAVTYDLPYTDGQAILIGSVECADVETATGYLAVTSQLNLKLTTAASAEDAAASSGLMEIAREEIPGNYRLLAPPPVLKAYKYVSSPHRLALKIDAYERGQVIDALVEVMGATSRLAVHEDHRTEAVTTIRYKVKNTSSQFLTLRMPAGATVWATRLIERDEATGQESARRLTASFDEKRGLMIPLPRPRDPNEPITVELEYGQVLGELAWWQSHISLEAPQSAVPATFASWTVGVSEDYAIRPASTGNMAPQRSVDRPGDLAWVLDHVLRSWAQGIEWIVQHRIAFVAAYALIVVALMGIVALIRRSAVPSALVMALLIGLLLVGIVATETSTFQKQLPAVDHMTTARFTKAVNVDTQGALRVDVVTIPAWRRHVPMSTVVAGPVLLLVALGLTLRRRRWRWLGLVTAVAVLGYSLAQFAVMTVPLGHLFTWGLGALGLAWFMWARVIRPLRAHRSIPVVAAAAVALIGCTMMLGGCGGRRPTVVPISDKPVLEKITCELTAGKDAMDLAYTLNISAPEPMRFALLDQSAVLMSSDHPHPNVRVELNKGQYDLVVRQPGVYEVELRFIVPLCEADVDQVRRFQLALPMALSNRITLTVDQPDYQIEAPTAMRFEQKQVDGKTVASAMFGPGDPIHFAWRPRARQTRLEATRFYGHVTSVARFDAGLVESSHRLHLQIAQGELKRITLAIPDNMTVTSVRGDSIGAWRYDPASDQLEVRLSQPVANAYDLSLVTQAAVDATPYPFTIRPITIAEAQRQWNLVGLVATPAVYLTATSDAQPINVDDFARDAAAVLSSSIGKVTSPRAAYRLVKADQTIRVDVAAVQPELRAEEMARFDVADETLRYNAQVTVTIAKAGVFSLRLRIPAAYDIDTLTAEQISHWDETVEDDHRVVSVYFTQKRMGAVPINLLLSRPIGQMPEHLDVPRVAVDGALKHIGQLVISPSRGVRLSVTAKQGVSEFNPAQVNIRQPGILAFRLLRPNWSLTIQTEVLEPLITTEFVHVARVSEGMVRHSHYLWYRLRHAGVKVLAVRVPADGLGLTISGPQIARRRQIEPGLWHIELAEKWFDRPYLLRINYQSRFDRTTGQVPLVGVQPLNADQVRGHVVMFTSERIELSADAATLDPALQPAEARNISDKFTAGDLSDAAFCFAASSADYKLTLTAHRHAAADLLEADVRQTNITSVITPTGQSINRVQLELMVGSKRHLRVRLPGRSHLWSLLVNGRAAIPSRVRQNDRDTWLIPLAQAAAGDLPVSVDLVYVNIDRLNQWSGRLQFHGPRFDLPLKKINWTFHLPEGFTYDDFKGTLTQVDEDVNRPVVLRYDMRQYEQTVSQGFALRNKKARTYMDKARQAAEQGGKFGQYQAREMLEQARIWSLNDKALNEDINVDLDNLLRQQAKAGLVGNRIRLRRQAAEDQPQANRPPLPDSLGDDFSSTQVKNIESALSAADNENLDLIARRIINMQETAAPSRIQLTVQMPQQGRVLRFTRPLQVEPDSDMTVSFQATEQITGQLPRGLVWAVGLFVALTVGLGLCSICGRGIDRAEAALARPRPSRSARRRVTDDQVTDADGEPVSASELNLPEDQTDDQPDLADPDTPSTPAPPSTDDSDSPADSDDSEEPPADDARPDSPQPPPQR